MKRLKQIRLLCDNELNDTLESFLQSTNLQDIGERLLTDDIDPDIDTVKAIEDLLVIAQYIETDTVMESQISDELYDSLHAKYNKLTGNSIVGTQTKSTKPTKQHKYPELRGSLSKVHFIRKKQVPENDSRKSFEDWLQSVITKCSPIHEKLKISPNFKFDGLSGVFECDGTTIETVLTRKNVDTNEGVDITYIFKNTDISKLLPSACVNCKFKFGLKVELLVTTDLFDTFSQSISKNRKPKNRRSAASMIINTTEDEFNPDWSNYISIMPLQLSSTEKFVPDNGWKYICEMNGRYQFIKDTNNTSLVSTNNIESCLSSIKQIIDNFQDKASDFGVPIDGVVFTIWNEDIVNKLGRENNINKFQIAYKIPAGEKKTILKNITFPVGPLGTVTPLAEVEPIIIMGNTITNVTLSNYNKLDRLNLHIGDEVIIKYDIVPTIYKDKSCKETTNPQIHGPELCPSCGEPLEFNSLIIRCTNHNCPSRKIGTIYNYIKKMGIPSIGQSTIEDLVENGFVNSIIDLYGLEGFRDQIINLQGYGEKSFNTIVSSINSKRVVYPHELLGSLGIPDVGRTIMKKVCKEIPFYELLEIEDPCKLTKIKGIGDIIAAKIIAGINRNAKLIEYLLLQLELKNYNDNKTKVVLFTGVRDKKFAEYLESTGMYEIANGYSNKVDIVVTKNDEYTSSKVINAQNDNKEIVSIDNFKRMTNYV